jgi:hypothetical protein
MTNNALIQNIQTIEKELKWFEMYLEARIAQFFNNEFEKNLEKKFYQNLKFI